MFDEEEESEPCADAYKALYHFPHCHLPDGAHCPMFPAWQTRKTVAPGVAMAPCIDDEGRQRNDFGKCRADCGTFDTQCRQTAVSEYQHPVQQNIREQHHHRVHRQCTGLHGTDEESPQHGGGKSYRECRHAPADIACSRGLNGIALHHRTQDAG